MQKLELILKNERFKNILNNIIIIEENRIFCKHDFEHLLNVARIMTIENLENKLSIDKELIYITAFLHDIGREDEYKKGIPHSKAGAEIAREILIECGFEINEINKICNAIYCHNAKNDNIDKLGVLLEKSDKLSRNCFMCQAFDKCKWSEAEKNMTINI